MSKSKSAPRYIVIDGKPYLWSEVLRVRREQLASVRMSPPQPELFEVKHDTRPTIERKAADRYLQPALFTVLDSSKHSN